MPDNGNQKEALLEVTGLKKYFPIKRGFFKRVVGYVRAVDDVSFKVERGEIVWIDGDQAFAFLLIEHAFLVHAHVVLRGVESPVFDVDIEFGQVEVGTDLEFRDDAVLVVVAEGDTAASTGVYNAGQFIVRFYGHALLA